MHPLNKAAPFSVLRPSAGGVNYAENPDPIGEHFVDNEVGEFRYDQLTRVRHEAIQVSDRIWRPLDSHRLSVVPGFEATCLLRRRKLVISDQVVTGFIYQLVGTPVRTPG